jgi:hypothetical protein
MADMPLLSVISSAASLIFFVAGSILMPSVDEYPDVAREKKLNLDVAQKVGQK